MKQYPAAFRDRLLRALDAGLPRAEAARAFGVSERSIQRWQRRRRETGGAAPAPRRTPRSPSTATPGSGSAASA